MSELSEHLRQLREAKGLTQAALADLAGVSQGAICQYELGTIAPRAGRLVALARALEVSEEELFSLAGYGAAASISSAGSGTQSTHLSESGLRADDRLVRSLARVLADFVRDRLADDPDLARVAEAFEEELFEGSQRKRPRRETSTPAEAGAEATIEFGSVHELFRALPSSISEN